ncbi:MAG: sigma-70 family RNA polymerase sigma factor [Spirochaetales bacterium]|nr:sigma-70 family RNA polymerase sigma factor [Spirochaetales bacterium]
MKKTDESPAEESTAREISKTSDTVMVGKTLEGNSEAFGELYEKYFDKIYNYLYYRTLHKETAEDLTSRTFMKSLEKLSTYSSEKGAFSTWLYRIAGNLLVDHFRTSGRTETISAVWDLPSEEEEFVIDIHNKLYWEKLKPVLDSLPTEKREIVIMRIWDDLSFGEIAEITGKSVGACKMGFARTLKNLKDSVPISLLAVLILFTTLIETGR